MKRKRTNRAMRLICAFTLAATASSSSGDQKTLNRPAPVEVVVVKVAVLGPVTGGQVTAGRVDINANAPASGATVQMSSNNEIATPPRNVAIAGGTSFAIFQVSTQAVVNTTSVTLSAQAGTSPPATASVTVVPPKLAVLGCDNPPNATPSKPLDCKVWLDGPAAEDVGINMQAENPMIVLVDWKVTVQKGNRNAPFFVKAKPLAQSASTRVIATYAGETKSTPVNVTPVALKAFQMVEHHGMTTLVGGQPANAHVELTAPAPPAGIRVKYSAKVTATHETNPHVPIVLPPFTQIYGGSTSEDFPIEVKGVASQMQVTLRAATTDFTESPDAATLTLTVLPAQIHIFKFDLAEVSAVPLGGEAVTLRLEFYSPGIAPPGGAHVALAYSGETQITGPAELLIGEGQSFGVFTSKVFPCSIQSPCKVYVTATYAGSKATAMLPVKH